MKNGFLNYASDIGLWYEVKSKRVGDTSKFDFTITLEGMSPEFGEAFGVDLKAIVTYDLLTGRLSSYAENLTMLLRDMPMHERVNVLFDFMLTGINDGLEQLEIEGVNAYHTAPHFACDISSEDTFLSGLPRMVRGE